MLLGHRKRGRIQALNLLPGISWGMGFKSELKRKTWCRGGGIQAQISSQEFSPRTSVQTFPGKSWGKSRGRYLWLKFHLRVFLGIYLWKSELKRQLEFIPPLQQQKMSVFWLTTLKLSPNPFTPLESSRGAITIWQLNSIPRDFPGHQFFDAWIPL